MISYRSYQERECFATILGMNPTQGVGMSSRTVTRNWNGSFLSLASVARAAGPNRVIATRLPWSTPPGMMRRGREGAVTASKRRITSKVDVLRSESAVSLWSIGPIGTEVESDIAITMPIRDQNPVRRKLPLRIRRRRIKAVTAGKTRDAKACARRRHYQPPHHLE